MTQNVSLWIISVYANIINSNLSCWLQNNPPDLNSSAVTVIVTWCWRIGGKFVKSRLMTGWASCWLRSLRMHPDRQLSLAVNPHPHCTLWDSCMADRSQWKHPVFVLTGGVTERSQSGWEKAPASVSEPEAWCVVVCLSTHSWNEHVCASDAGHIEKWFAHQPSPPQSV